MWMGGPEGLLSPVDPPEGRLGVDRLWGGEHHAATTWSLTTPGDEFVNRASVFLAQVDPDRRACITNAAFFYTVVPTADIANDYHVRLTRHWP